MPMTALDTTCALLVIDLQNGLRQAPTLLPVELIAQRAGALAKTFRKLHLPVVLVNAAATPPGRTEQGHAMNELPAEWLTFMPELGVCATDHQITKRTWGAFASTDLHAWLQARGVTQVVIAGVATTMGVESTAREAHSFGYNVTLAVDVMTDLSESAQNNSFTTIFPRIGEQAYAQEIVAMLTQRS